MNQILFTNNDNNNNNKVDVKKIIVIFSIAIIVVALAIASIKIYGLYQEKVKSKNYATPEIIVIKQEETKDVVIKATCKDGISYLVYTWNDEDENRVNLNGSTTFERIIEMPQNQTNTLKVEVVSTNNVNAKKTEIFEGNIDNTKPTIDSISIVDKKLNIQASDDTGIKYLTYKWENEEEVVITADENNNKTISTEVDIQRGTYKLTITVVDIYENEEVLSKLITGVNEPEISVIKYGNIVKISTTHDKGFKKIEYIINNSTYVYDESYSQYDKNKTTVEYSFPLKEGENIIKVRAYSLEKLAEDAGEELENYSFKKYAGKCTYEQQ